MSVREEDREKKECSSGLGLAAAVIGVGAVVGGALYYFLKNSPENPHSAGSTSTGRIHERPQVLRFMDQSEESDSYTTISEHSTSDTSILDDTCDLRRAWSIDSNSSTMYVDDSLVSINDSTVSENDSTVSESNTSVSETDSSLSETNSSLSETNFSLSEHYTSVSEDSDTSNEESSMTELSVDSQNDSATSEEANAASGGANVTFEDYATPDPMGNDQYNELMNSVFETIESTIMNLGNEETGYLSSLVEDITSDSETAMEWDITNSSLDIPRHDRSPMRNLIDGLRSMISPRKNRERSWSLEECSICFDVLLKDQELMTLPCTHHFHAACIMPWLQQKQTCPNCRKSAD